MPQKAFFGLYLIKRYKYYLTSLSRGLNAMPTPETLTKKYLMESQSAEVNSIRLLSNAFTYPKREVVAEFIANLPEDDFYEVLTQKSNVGNGYLIHYVLATCSIDLVQPMLLKIQTLDPKQQKSLLTLLTQPQKDLNDGATALIVAALHNQSAVSPLLDIITQLNDPGFTAQQLTQSVSNGTNALFLTLTHIKESQSLTPEAFNATLRVVNTLPAEDQKIIFSQITKGNREVLTKAMQDSTPMTVNKLLDCIMRLPLQYILEIDSVIGLTELHAVLLKTLSKKEGLVDELVDLYALNEPLRNAKKEIITPETTLRPHIEQILNDIINAQNEVKHQKNALIALTLIRQAQSVEATSPPPDKLNESGLALFTMKNLQSRFKEYQSDYQSINNTTHLLYSLYTQLKNKPGDIADALIKVALNREKEKNRPEALLALALIANLEGKNLEAQDYLHELKGSRWVPSFFKDPIPQALLSCTPLQKNLADPRTRAINLFIAAFKEDIQALLNKPVHLDEDKPSLQGGIN